MTDLVFKQFTRLTKSIIILLFGISLPVGMIQGQNEFDILRNNWLEYSNASNSLYHYLSDQACEYLKQRENAIKEINTLDLWKQRQKYIRETLAEIIGPFPEKTPLNPVITGTIINSGYTVENIVYESQPGFYVTSSLFLPHLVKKNSSTPAIIYCSGHSAEGYRNAVYQHVILNLVNKGFIVFAFDPIGQGERLEYFDKGKGKSIIGGPTLEHSYPGAQAFLTGSSLANYMIWDGIRAVDYLLTRKEVDPARIGITGRSGGGTQSAYIAAMDDRIYASAPENYLTNFTRLLQSIGPQDAEQNIAGLILRGLDHPDLLIVRAPKPSLMITTTSDMFSIQGALETEKEVAGIYKAYNKEDNFSRAEDDAGHASTKKNRESMYAFFQKHLNNPGDPHDEEVTLIGMKDLQVTATGQVSTSLKSTTVFSINRILAENLVNNLNRLRVRPEQYLPHVIESAKRLSGYREPKVVENPVFTGRIIRAGYVIEKFFIKGEGNYMIPYLLFKPATSSGKAMIYLNPAGKSAEATPGGEIEKFVNQGITVLAPDLLGVGELNSVLFRGDANFDGVSHNIWYAAILIGRSITGIQAGDVVRLAGILKQNNEFNEICGLARRELAPVLLHAAAFSVDINSIILLEPYSSFISLVKMRYYDPRLIPGTVPGALGQYDLPDLASTLAPRKLFIEDIKDGSGSVADFSCINKDTGIIIKAYHNCKADGKLLILTGKSADIKFDLLLSWIK